MGGEEDLGILLASSIASGQSQLEYGQGRVYILIPDRFAESQSTGASKQFLT